MCKLAYCCSAANALILEANAFKIIQIAAKHSVMGVVTWQLLEHHCIRLDFLAPGWRLVQLERILRSDMENVKRGCSESPLRYKCRVDPAQRSQPFSFLLELILVSCVVAFHAMSRARMIYDCGQDNVSSPLPVRSAIYYSIVEQETESRRALHDSRKIRA